MGRNLRTQTKAGILALALIFAISVFSLPSLGGGVNDNSWCWAGIDGAEAKASITDQDSGGVGAYAYAEATFYFSGSGHTGDGPNYDDAVVSAHAKELSFPWDIALDSYSEYWVLAEGTEYYDEDDCSHSFIGFNEEAWENMPPGLKDHLSVVSCVKDDSTTSYAYSGEIYYDAQVNTTFLWQGSDGFNITANPDLNSVTPSITGMTSQAQSEGLNIEAYGSSSWGCKLEISWV